MRGMTYDYAPMKPMPIRITEATRQRLAQLAALNGTTQQEHIRQALVEYLDRELPNALAQEKAAKDTAKLERKARAAARAEAKTAKSAKLASPAPAKKAVRTNPQLPATVAPAAQPVLAPTTPTTRVARPRRQASPTYR